MEEFGRNFNGRPLPRELIQIHAFQQHMPDFAQGSALIEHDGSALTPWSAGTVSRVDGCRSRAPTTPALAEFMNWAAFHFYRF